MFMLLEDIAILDISHTEAASHTNYRVILFARLLNQGFGLIFHWEIATHYNILISLAILI
jgi:hypothetical protein